MADVINALMRRKKKEGVTKERMKEDQEDQEGRKKEINKN
jgi:hypothetical protein